MGLSCVVLAPVSGGCDQGIGWAAVIRGLDGGRRIHVVGKFMLATGRKPLSCGFLQRATQVSSGPGSQPPPERVIQEGAKGKLRCLS